MIALLSVLTWTCALHAEWSAAGNPVCTAVGNQDNSSLQSTSDGAGGAIFVWEDMRSGETDLYAQRIDAAGNALWTYNGICICNALNVQENVRIIPDGLGGAIIAWEDRRNFTEADNRIETWAQRVAANGTPHWTANGTRIYTYPNGWNTGVSMTTDGANGAIITWFRRSLADSGPICCERITGAGVKWHANDWECLEIRSSGARPAITSDGAGGAIVAWRMTGSMKVQRVSPTGSLLWSWDGISISSAGDYAAIIADGAGGAIIAWNNTPSGASRDIYAQRVNSSGVVQWTAGGKPICTADDDQYEARIATNGSNGAFVIWRDGRNNGDVYLATVSAGGVSSSPVPICTLAPTIYDHTIIADGLGGAYISWYDWRTGYWGIYAQRLNSSGTPQWTLNGLAVYSAYSTERRMPALASDGNGGVIVAWEDARNGDFDIYAKRLTPAGETPIATLLQNFTAGYDAGGIRIAWTLSEADENLELLLSRAEAPFGLFEEIPASGISREGLEFSFIDRGIEPGRSYLYRVEVSANGERRILFETNAISTPALPLALCQNRPNPFNPSTTISFSLPGESAVRLEVYDVSGRLVARLLDGEKRGAGPHDVEWNGRDASGRAAASGIYVYRLVAGKETISRKMVLLR
jgi:hypothetical protein